MTGHGGGLVGGTVAGEHSQTQATCFSPLGTQTLQLTFVEGGSGGSCHGNILLPPVTGVTKFKGCRRCTLAPGRGFQGSNRLFNLVFDEGGIDADHLSGGHSQKHVTWRGRGLRAIIRVGSTKPQTDSGPVETCCIEGSTDRIMPTKGSTYCSMPTKGSTWCIMTSEGCIEGSMLLADSFEGTNLPECSLECPGSTCTM